MSPESSCGCSGPHPPPLCVPAVSVLLLQLVCLWCGMWDSTPAGGSASLALEPSPSSSARVGTGDTHTSHSLPPSPPRPAPGRSLVLQMLRRAKYREVMLSELKGRPLKGCKLGAEYIIHDIIGADLVDR